MNKIIEIVPAEDFFSVSWVTQLRCNYDCMYCPPERHNLIDPMPSLEQLQSRWTTIFEQTKHRNKRYKIDLTGGELTMNKALLPFLQWLRDNYHQHIHHISFSTNGSASTNFYLKLYQYVDHITFSTHTEHINAEKFFSTAIKCNIFAKLHPPKHFMVNIMQEFWAVEQIKDFVYTCEKNNIYYNISKIDYTVQTRPVPIFKNK